MDLEKIKIFLLGAITVLLAVLVFEKTPMPIEKVLAANNAGMSAGMSAEGLLAMVGENNDLFIIDARNQRVAVYDYSNTSGRLYLKAARNFSNDIRVNTEIYSSKGLNYAAVKAATAK